MSRKCSTCQHVKRAEIDRRLAAGEPGSQIAQDYGINPSSLHRHRTNCLKLASSSLIMKEAARGTAAAACLPSPGQLGNAYAELKDRIDGIARQAAAEGSLKTALSGLNSVRQTLDSLSRLAAHNEANRSAPVPNNGDLDDLVDRLILRFDHEPELKEKLARALLEMNDEQLA
ncbi:hypothetical protein AB7M56_004777 [Bradyrhizobium elkanii]|nr:hypothetical protein [Bradyrhizobium elkanii]BBC01161.1 hypothetical protein BE61_66220 [Bradyrhizobium elkanii USDA 61]